MGTKKGQVRKTARRAYKPKRKKVKRKKRPPKNDPDSAFFDPFAPGSY